MVKVLLFVLIVAFTTFLGWFLSGKYRKKMDYFIDLCDFNDRFLSELSFQRRPLSDFIQALPNKRDLYDDVDHVLQDKACVRESYLSEEEKTFCRQYLSYLGKGDAYSQQSFFLSQKEQLAKRRSESEASAKKQTELYFKLGFLAGLALVILLV